jgi:hypothetical protein
MIDTGSAISAGIGAGVCVVGFALQPLIKRVLNGKSSVPDAKLCQGITTRIAVVETEMLGLREMVRDRFDRVDARLAQIEKKIYNGDAR